MAQTIDVPVVCPILVGRAAALAALRKRLDLAAAGQGELVLVSGTAGIGKSRLVTEAAGYARAQQVRVLRGQCFEVDRDLPWAPILDLVRTAAAADLAAVARALSEAPRAAGWLPPELVPPAPVPEPAPSLGVELDRRRDTRELTRFVEMVVAGGPLLLVIEDLHWSDDATLDAILDLARWLSTGRPACVVATYRDDEVGPDLARLLAALDRERRAVEIRLEPLSAEDVAAMLRALSDRTGMLPPAVVADVVALGEGNPFFVEELLRSALSADPDSSPLAVPRTVDDAVRRRLRHLNDGARQTATLAAVAGRRFDFALLQALCACDEEEMLRRVKALIGAGLVVEDRSPAAAPRGWFAFRHALTRQAIYADLLDPERRTLHRAVFTVMQRDEATTRGHADDGRRLADLARHAFVAGAWEEALAYGQRAGELALQMHAPRLAGEQFTRAIEAAARLERSVAPALYRARGRAREQLGEFDAARRDFETAVALARAAGDRREEGEGLLALGELWAGRDYTTAGAYLHAARDAALQADDRAGLARSLNRLGNWHANRDEPASAFALHQAALAIVEDLGNQRGIAETLDLMGMASFLGGDLAGSARSFRRVIPLLRESDDRRTLINALVGLAFSLSVLDSPIAIIPQSSHTERWALVEEAVRVAREIDGRAEEAFTLCGGALIAAERDLDLALEYVQRGLRIAEEIGHRQWMILGHYIQADLFQFLLEHDAARAHLETALALAHEVGSAFWVREVLGDLATIAALDGDIANAETLIAQAVDEQTPMQTADQREAWFAWAQVALARGAPDRALDVADRLLAVATSDIARDLVRLPPLALLRGEALTALDRGGEARVALDAARDGATSQEHLALLWRVHVARAALFRRLGQRTAVAGEIAAAHATVAAFAGRLADPVLREAFHRRAVAQLPPLRAPSARQAAKAAHGGLTARECEVAALIAAGLTNREIGERLFLSEWTVATHVRNILARLDLSTRAQIAAWAQERRLTAPQES